MLLGYLKENVIMVQTDGMEINDKTYTKENLYESMLTA